MTQAQIVIDTVGKLNPKKDGQLAYCDNCQRRELIDIPLVIARKGPDLRLDQLKNHVRCKGCGGRPDRIQFVANIHVRPG